MNLQFQYPQLLWALAALAIFLLCYVLNIAWKKRTAKRLGDPHLVKELLKAYSPLKFALKFFLIFTAFALGCLALANPRMPEEGSGEARKGIDIAIALDVSNSMLADDIKPNRLTLAKRLIRQLLTRIPNDRVSLIFFAGNAYVQMPLTFDHGAIEMQITTASPGDIRAQGTAISEALHKSNLSFQQDISRFKAVVLISDGESHDQNAIDTAHALAERGVMINTIGIGSPTGAAITDTISGGVRKDLNGNVVISKLNEPLLQDMAKLTNGLYLRLDDPKQGAEMLAAHLAQIEKKALGDASAFNYTTFYMWAALPMLLLLILELFISDRKKGVVL